MSTSRKGSGAALQAPGRSARRPALIPSSVVRERPGPFKQVVAYARHGKRFLAKCGSEARGSSSSTWSSPVESAASASGSRSRSETPSSPASSRVTLRLGRGRRPRSICDR
jgi:hypothetical protein